MAYENSDNELYQWGQDATFGSTTVVHFIMGPKGKVGLLRDVFVEVTTSLVGTTTVPEVMVGISSGDATFGRYRLGTAIGTGYGVGPHRASAEAISGNPPRTLADFAAHVVLDGGPLTSQGVAGGSFGTLVPAGRIPAGPLKVTNVISGAAGVCRLFVDGLTTAPGGFKVGQTVLVQGVAGATGANGQVAISAIETGVPPAWIELTGTTFGGTYTSGGFVHPVVVVTLALGTGGSPAGGGHVKVEIQWIGAETP